MQDAPARLSISDWITIGIFVASAFGVVIWYFWRRFIGRMDTYGDELHGPKGVVAQLRTEIHERVPKEALDVEMSEIEGRFNSLMRQGDKRESAILKAIERMENHVREDARLLRQDLSAMHARVDAVLAQKTGARRN